MPKMGIGIDGPDLGPGPDLAAVGNVARASKAATSAPQELTTFSVKRGDNGGVLVCETYTKKAPEGRRASSYGVGGGDYKENPFSPDDGAAAASHVTGLLSQMGVTAPAPEVPAPDVTAVRGPNATAVGVGGGGMFEAPEGGGY